MFVFIILAIGLIAGFYSGVIKFSNPKNNCSIKINPETNIAQITHNLSTIPINIPVAAIPNDKLGILVPFMISESGKVTNLSNKTDCTIIPDDEIGVSWMFPLFLSSNYINGSAVGIKYGNKPDADVATTTDLDGWRWIGDPITSSSAHPNKSITLPPPQEFYD